jgi:hypothetical protein
VTDDQALCTVFVLHAQFQWTSDAVRSVHKSLNHSSR